MGVAMHAKSDSDVTSVGAVSPPRSPRRSLYFVQSPAHSHHDLEKMSFGSSPFGSPAHHFQYHSSSIHHSRESSTSRFSVSLKNGGWRRIQKKFNEGVMEEEEDADGGSDGEGSDSGQVKFYVICFLLSFVVLFTLFSLILWASSFAYKPKIIVKSFSFESLNVQAGMDATGVPTDMLSLNSTVRIFYSNPATFFGVHVTSTPLLLHFFDLKIASGQMTRFYQSRRSARKLVVVVEGQQVPLYGGIPLLNGAKQSVAVPLNLTLRIRSRAYILGRLVKPKFYRNIVCSFTLRGNHLGRPLNLTRTRSCVYD